MWKLHMYSTQMIDCEQMRTLFIRLPHVIRKRDEVKTLFFGDIKIRFPRQSSRHCYVVFPNMEEALKNLKALKNKTINGKRVIVYLLRSELLDKKKRMKNMETMLKIGNYEADMTSEEESSDSSEDSEDAEDNSASDEIENATEKMTIEK